MLCKLESNERVSRERRSTTHRVSPYLFSSSGSYLRSLRKADVSPRLSSLRDVSRGGTSATQRRKFHTDDVNQCLHNKSSSHGVPNVNFFNFMFLLVDFEKVLRSSVNELQQNSNASSRLYSTNIDCFVRDSSRLHLTFVAFCL